MKNLAIEQELAELKALLAQKEAEIMCLRDEIEEVKFYYENLIALLPGHVYWMDVNNVFLGCNDQQAKNAGFEHRKEIIGKTNYDMLWKDQAEALNQLNNKVMESGQAYMEEEYAVMANGPGYYLSHKAPLRNRHGDIVGMLGVSLDITAHKRAEENEKIALAKSAEEKVRAAETEEQIRQAVMIIVGSMVHDMRTPIAIINVIGSNLNKYLPQILEGYYKSVEKEMISNKIRKNQLDILGSSGNTLRKIADEMNEYINQSLKTLSRTIASDLSRDDLVKCSMGRCIRETIDQYPFVDQEEELFEVNYDDEFDFMGNEISMIRILCNLIKNSLYQIKQNEQGKILIWMESDESFNTLHFKDTAGGVEEHFIPNLFEGYHTNKKGGTGIGLVFCRKTMEDFGGKIFCQSKFGEYIEFLLKFPRNFD